MDSTMPLPANALVFSKSVKNADFMKRVMMQLERKKVSGYLLVKDKDVEGYLFLRQGKAFNARFSVKSSAANYLIGTEAVRALNTYCDENAHELLVYLLNSNTIDIVAGLATGRYKHMHLSTEFVNILKFTRHLVVNKFNGYMHVLITTSNRCAVCAYTQGRATECILYPLKGYEVVCKLDHWQLFLTKAQEQGAIFSAFESVESPWNPEKFDFLPTDQPHLQLLNDLFAICEKAFYSRNINANFEELFVDACIQITDQYPFMHPFENEVHYENGKLEIGDNLDPKTVLKALNVALREVFRMAGRNDNSILAEVKAHIKERIETDKTDKLKKFVDFFPLLKGGSH